MRSEDYRADRLGTDPKKKNFRHPEAIFWTGPCTSRWVQSSTKLVDVATGGLMHGHGANSKTDEMKTHEGGQRLFGLVLAHKIGSEVYGG